MMTFDTTDNAETLIRQQEVAGIYEGIRDQYAAAILGSYKREKTALELLKDDIGDELFYNLSDEDKRFIIETEGSISIGRLADESDLTRIEKSLREDYEY